MKKVKCNNRKAKESETKILSPNSTLNTQNSPLPKGWVWVRLGDVCDIIRGISFPKEAKVKNYRDKYLPCLRTANVQTEVDWNDLWFIPNNFVKSEDKIIKHKDILISNANSLELVGKVSLVKYLPYKEVTFGAFISVIRVNENLNKDFIYYQLKSDAVQSKIRSIASTTTNISNVNTSKLINIEILLPPLAEQQRIVSKIEELFTKLDAGVDALKKAKEQIKRYRQAVLKYAFEGKLTEEWRKTNRDKLESASVLLERIKEERKKKLGKKYKELPPIDTSELPELPKGWVWVRLGEVIEKIPLKNKKLKQKEYKETGKIPVIDQGKMFIGGYTDRADLKISCSDPVIVFGDHTKVIKYVDFDFVPGADGIKVIRPLKIFFTKLFYYFLHSVELPEKGYARHFQFLEKSYISLPPFAEQQKIVEEIERRFSVADEVEKAIDNSLKQAERLRQSILKKAFEGKLVPQDPNDEPAEKLLKRIMNYEF